MTVVVSTFTRTCKTNKKGKRRRVRPKNKRNLIYLDIHLFIYYLQMSTNVCRRMVKRKEINIFNDYVGHKIKINLNQKPKKEWKKHVFCDSYFHNESSFARVWKFLSYVHYNGNVSCEQQQQSKNENKMQWHSSIYSCVDGIGNHVHCVKVFCCKSFTDSNERERERVRLTDTTCQHNTHG